MKSIFKNRNFWILISLIIITAIFIVTVSIATARHEKNWTQLEDIYFQVFFGIFSLLIGFYFEKLFSLEEIKQFARSAYRRIIDIKSLVNRQTEFLENVKKKPSISIDDIQAMDEISYALNVSIDSSTSDWGEIIGDEVKNVKKMQQLQEELKLKILASSNQEQLIATENEIRNLRESIPIILRQEFEAPRPINTYDTPMELINLYRYSLKTYRELILIAKIYEELNAEQYDYLKKLQKGSILYLGHDQAMHSITLMIRDTKDYSFQSRVFSYNIRVPGPQGYDPIEEEKVLLRVLQEVWSYSNVEEDPEQYFYYPVEFLGIIEESFDEFFVKFKPNSIPPNFGDDIYRRRI